jgi:predicted TIM-barrel fold metal-dependent hydrolase
MSVFDDVELIDHHCHGLLAGFVSNDDFRVFSTESDVLSDEGLETLDSPLGLAIRKVCAPLLDLERHSPIDEYLTRRAELGSVEVNRRLMAAAHTSTLLIDTGFASSRLLSPDEMRDAFSVETHTIVRLESIAETVAPTSSSGAFIADFRAALAEAAVGAVGFKSIIAYRFGLDLEDTAPSPARVETAVGSWIDSATASGEWRVSDPAILQHLLWEAVGFGMPIQIHVGYGDSDIELFRADPSRATKFFRATQNSGAKFTLLHCDPFVRESAVLSQIFPHVYCDVGSVSHFLGPSAFGTIRQVMEIAPFNKILYSSDAHALAEQYVISAESWRDGMQRLMNEWISSDWLIADDAAHYLDMIANGNATRIYGLGSVA